MTRSTQYPSKVNKTTETIQQGTWLLSDENTVTKIMAIKKQNRLRKDKTFNGFVLICKKEHNEFKTFITTLKQNIAHIPNNTRMSLAIRTMYYAPEFDTKPDLLHETKTSPKHWTAVDLLVDDQKNIHSFVLDAANSIGYQGIHHELKKYFPKGRHYIFEEDRIEFPDGSSKTRIIQTQRRGCHIFALHHLSLLSQIDTQTLYHHELPRLAAKNPNHSGMIQPGDFLGELRLTKIFTSTQSLSTIESLTIKDTLITQKDQQITLLESIKTRSSAVSLENMKQINQTINYKNKRYVEKEFLFDQYSREKKARIMNTRTGYLFLKNRGLFNLNNALKQLNNPEELHLFLQKIYEILKKTLYNCSIRTQNLLGEINDLSCSIYLLPEEMKHNLILIIEDLFFQISMHKQSRSIQMKCNKAIEATLFVFFKCCQTGIIHSNKHDLLLNNASLRNLDEALKSIDSLVDIQKVIHHINDKINPTLPNEINSYKHELDELMALLRSNQIALKPTYDFFMFIIASLYFYSIMADDNTLKAQLNMTIDRTLSLYFDEYYPDTPKVETIGSVLSHSLFRHVEHSGLQELCANQALISQSASDNWFDI